MLERLGEREKMEEIRLFKLIQVIILQVDPLQIPYFVYLSWYIVGYGSVYVYVYVCVCNLEHIYLTDCLSCLMVNNQNN